MSTKVFRLSSFLFVVFLAISAAGFEFLVLAQDSTNQNAAAATSTKKSTTRRRKGSRHKVANTNTTTDATVPLAAADMPAAPAAETTEQTDLSGTYIGTFDCGDAGVSGPTTLTVTGNQFTTDGGKSGRIVASTTRGYTGVAMQFGEVVMPKPGQPAGPPPTIVSMRAKKSGDRLTLTTVPGATHVCSFTPSGASGRTRHRRSRAAAVPAEPAMPAATETPATAAEPVTPPTPSRRRGRRGNGKTNMNTNTTTNDNTGTTEMTATPTPTPTPAAPRN
ncbi:MAG TPA: hypothetical protein VN951_02875 [Pyrinomonadaceae bacterium]|nr:hypothetical protein [Pyrinomonadaceae bacterium]